MKIRGNTVGTPIKPEKNLIKATDLTEEEKAQARENIGAADSGVVGDTEAALDRIIAIQNALMEGAEIDLSFEIDETLTKSGMAADAKAVGDRLASMVSVQTYTLPAHGVPCTNGTLVLAEAEDEYGNNMGNTVYVCFVDSYGNTSTHKLCGELSLSIDTDWDYGAGIIIDHDYTDYTVTIKVWY